MSPGGVARRVRRWSIRAAWCVALFALVLALAYALRTRVVAPLALRWLSDKLRREHGWELGVASVRGNWYDTLELDGLTLAKSDRSLRLEAASVELQFSLVKLYRGADDAIERVHVERPQLHVDRTKVAPGAPLEIGWPAHLPAVAIVDGAVDLKFAHERELAIEHLDLSSERDGEELRAAARRVAYDDPRLGRREGALSATGALHGGHFAVRELALDGAPLARDAVVDLEHVFQARVGWDATLATCGGTITTHGAFDRTHVETRISSENVDLAQAQRALRGLFDLSLAGRIDLEGRASLALDGSNDFSVEARFAARQASVRGAQFESLAGEVRVDPHELAVPRLTALRGKNQALVEGFSMPIGERDWLARLQKSRGRVSLDCTDVPALFGSEPPSWRVPQHAIQVIGSLSSEALILDSGRVTTPSGSLTISGGRLAWGPDAAHLLTLARIELDGRADFSDLSELGALISDDAWCGSARGAVHLVGGWRDLVGAVDLAGENVVAAGIPLGDLSLVATADERTLHVASLHAFGEWAEIDGSGDFEVRSRRVSNGALHVGARAGSPIFPSWLEQGLVELDLQIDGELAAPRVAFSGVADEVELRGRTFERIEARGSWQGDAVVFDHLRARFAGVEAVATGTLSSIAWRPPFQVELESLHVAREGRELDLIVPTRLKLDRGAVDFDHMNLAGNAGKLIAACHWQPDRTALAFEVQELDTLGLLAPYLPRGVALDGLHGSVEVQIVGETIDAAAQVRIDRFVAKEGGRPYSVESRFAYGAKRLEVERLELARDGATALSLVGSLPIDPRAADPWLEGALRLKGALRLESLDELPFAPTLGAFAVRGGAALEFDLDGSWREPHGTLSLKSDALSLEAATLQGAVEIGPFALSTALRLEHRVIVDALQVADSDRARLAAHGALEWNADLAALFAHRFPSLDAVPLAFDAELAADDLGFIARTTSALRRTAGKLEAHWKLGGTLARPSWNGELSLAGGEVRFAADLPALTALDAQVSFDGYRAKLDSFSGELGSGPFTLAGTVELGEGAPKLDLALDGKEILLARGSGYRLRADAKLTAQGAWTGLRIGGALALRDGRYNKNFDLLGRIASSAKESNLSSPTGIELRAIHFAPFARAEFDVDIRASDPFRVENNVVRSNLRPELRLRGSGEHLELSGAVFVDESRVYLPSGVVKLSGGTIFVKRENPIVPELELSGEVRMAGYDITVRVTGTTDKPEVQLSSSPPLAHSDLLVLVLTGRLPASTAGAAGEQAAQSVAVFFGQDLLSRWLSRDSDDGEPLIERIEWQQGREVTKSGGQTTELSVRMTSDEPGKRRIVYLQGEKDIYDRINFGLKILFRFP